MGMDVHAVFTYALQREHEGRSFFEDNAGRMSHAAAASIFRRLADEERKHIEFVEAQLAALGSTGKADCQDVGRMAERGFFTSRALSERLDQTVMQSMVPDLPILRTAYLIERDMSEFYETVASKTEDETKRALCMLARWERVHEQLFKDLHDGLFEEYTHMPWGG